MSDSTTPAVPRVTAELAWDAAKAGLRQAYLGLRTLALQLKARPAPALQGVAQPRRVLVIRLDRLGDVVLTTALLRALREKFPGAHLAYLVRPFVAPLLRRQEYLDEVVEAPLQPLKDVSWLAELRKREWDAVLDPFNGYALMTARLTRRIEPAVSAGFDIAGRGVFFTHAAPAPREASLAEQGIRLARALGWELPFMRPRIRADRSLSDWAQDWLARRGHGPWLIVHAGGYYPTQRLPAETMGRAAALIATRGRLSVLVLGGADESRLVRAVEAGIRRTRLDLSVHSATDLSIERLAAVLAQARAVFANNSGPLHLAAALGVPTLSTSGPSHPVVFAPLGSEPSVPHRVIRLGVACSPCNLAVCGHHTCLEAITAERILEAADALLADRTSTCG